MHLNRSLLCASLLAAILLSTGLVGVAQQAPPVDSDGDGVIDPLDNCIEEVNPTQCDADQDGYGTTCDADYDQDFFVGPLDWPPMRTAYEEWMEMGTMSEPAELDHNCDGVVGTADLIQFLELYASVPGPSGRQCAGSVLCQ